MLLNAYGILYREPGEFLQEMQDFAGTTGGAIHIAALTETWQHAGLDLPDLPGMQRSFAAPRQAVTCCWQSVTFLPGAAVAAPGTSLSGGLPLKMIARRQRQQAWCW